MEIIASIKNNSETALRSAFDTFHHKLYSYVYTKTKSEYLAQEVTQITFIKLWDRRKLLDETIPLSAQLFRIAKTSLIDLLRKEKYNFISFDKLLQPLEDNSDGYNKMEYKELDGLLKTAIEMLPAACKNVFKLSRFEGLSHKEIAQRLNISTKTVENHITKALSHLRLYLPQLAIAILLKIFQ